MDHRRNFSFIIALAIFLTSLGYWIDQEESYSNFTESLIEFIAIASGFAFCISLVYLIYWVFRSIFFKLKKLVT